MNRADSQYVVEYRALYHNIETGEIEWSYDYYGKGAYQKVKKLIKELDEGLHSELIEEGVKGNEFYVRLDSIERVEHYYSIIDGEKDFPGDRDEEEIWCRDVEYPEA